MSKYFANFTRASDAVFKFEIKFHKIRNEDHHLFSLEVMTEELKSMWEKAKASYEITIEALETAKEIKPEDLETIEHKYDNTFTTYVRCMKNLKIKQEELKSSTPVRDVETATGDKISHTLPLAPCDTDIFDGDYLTWPTFRDLFTAVYINNSRLSPIEKLCYLLKRTGKEAKEIVSKCPLTNDGFDVAWRNLRTTYENPRMLVNNQLKLLFQLETLTKETRAGLKSLQRGINSFLTSMSIYKVDITNWDPLIVFMCLQRLPSDTVSLWEQTVKDKSALSLWKDLDLFLTKRIQTLECIRDVTNNDFEKKNSDRKIKAHATSKSSPVVCVLCPKQNHMLRFCRRFKNLSVSDRFSTVKKFHCCVNCLSKAHEVKDCKSEHLCFKCNQKHHTMLHRETSGNNSLSNISNANNVEINSNLPSTSANAQSNFTRQVFHIAQNSSVLLGTAMVSIICQDTRYPARALIDPASEASFISERLRNQLRLPSHSTNVQISGVNSETSTISKKVCPVTLGSLKDCQLQFEMCAFVLPSISGNLPSFTSCKDIKSKLPNLKLADCNFYKRRPVDLLLGADVYPQIMLGSVRRNIFGSLMAQETVFGWILTGPIETSRGNSINVFSTSVTFSEEDNLNHNLQKFWELEETPKRKILSHSDKMCEDLYRKTTFRDSDGRYVVSLPFRPEFPQEISLGISRALASKQLRRIETLISKTPEVRDMYDEAIMDYLKLGHMRPISYANQAITKSCYLPHHPIIKPERKTTKLRVVFNASNKTSNGTSLNDCLFIGPTLQADLVNLILRWRLFRFVFNCDISKMYRQIRVHSSHTPFQRILYKSTSENQVRDYELQTVTFGLNCAPYLAIRTLLQLAEDCEDEFPEAAEILRKGMYVDDVLSGAHDVDSALRARDQLTRALLSAGFELRKWTANTLPLLKGLPSEHLIDSKVLTFEDSSCSKMLGIFWNAQLDSFFFKVFPLEVKSGYTKREVLSCIAKFFDPVGWLSPVIIKAKIIMQRIWLNNIDWDEMLISSIETEWIQFVEAFNHINFIQVPRWVNYYKDSVTEIHIFSDASEKAYAGVIYIRTEGSTGEICTHLLSSKTKVAPIKSISLPRLELCGAVLASELFKTIMQEIGIPIKRVYCWTDSTIVLAWLRKTPSSWTTFVANRVCRIQENTGGHKWFHVRSEDNPADLSSRGVDPLTLSQSALWWHGPSWLSQDKSQWCPNSGEKLETDLEVRKVKVHASFFSKFEDILERFSSLDRAMRVLAYIFRFYHSTHAAYKNRFQYETNIIQTEELERLKTCLVIVAQKAFYAGEYKSLLEKKPLSSRSSLKTLNPFLDDRQVMRLNGRLVKSPSLSYREQYPILLPYGCRFARLMAEWIHKLTIHGGNQLMLRVYRCEYWVPRLKVLIRTVIHKCKRCIIDRQRTCQQIMAALPAERTTIGRPFTTTGVDFAGPFDVKNYNGRACKITKGYVCIFVCFSTKAIHLEAVSDLSTDTFLAAFNRFIARRGCPHTMLSDNGTNFVGASNELARDHQTFLKECQARTCSAFGFKGLVWRFIPAGAPHMGGLWEAGVKSFKLHFRKEAQACRYTFEELSTVLARIEACLNSRPLCPLPDAPGEPVALTPGHFLIGSAILAPPEPTIYDSPISVTNRYRKIKALVHEFCKRWKEEYLINLHKRYKWQHPQRDVALNDLVVIKNEQLPATSWRLGVVAKIHTGTDGHVRVAELRTQNGVITRPITKLVVLQEN